MADIEENKNNNAEPETCNCDCSFWEFISWIFFLLFLPVSAILCTANQQFTTLLTVVKKEETKIIPLLEAVDGITRASNNEGSFQFHIFLETWQPSKLSCRYGDTGPTDRVKRAWLRFQRSMQLQGQFVFPISAITIGASAVLLTLAKTGDIVQLLALATVILAFSALVSSFFYSTSYGLLDNSTYCALVLNDAIKPKRSSCECLGSRKRFVFLSLVASQLQAIGSMALSFLTIALYHFKVATDIHISQKIFTSILGGLAAICAVLDLIQTITFHCYIADPLQYFEETWNKSFFKMTSNGKQRKPSDNEVKTWKATLDTYGTRP